jgi:hypothetical protein
VQALLIKTSWIQSRCGKNLAVRQPFFLTPQKQDFSTWMYTFVKEEMTYKAFVPSHQQHQPVQQILVKAGLTADGQKGELSTFNQQHWQILICPISTAAKQYGVNLKKTKAWLQCREAHAACIVQQFLIVIHRRKKNVTESTMMLL